MGRDQIDDKKNIIEAYISNGDTLTFIIDSGSSLTLVSEEIVKEMNY